MPQDHLENEPIHKNLLNQKGSFILILGVVIILVVLGVGGYFLTKNKNSNSNQYISQPTPTSTQPTSLNETANWKTYTFERVNSSVPKFQIKYPPNWDYREISAGDPLHLYFYTSSIGKLPRQVSDTGPADDPLLPHPLKAPIEIQVSIGWVDRCPCENIVIAGLPAKKIMLEYWEIIELVNGEYVLSIMRELKDNPNVDNSLSTEKEIEIFNNMVSTFKFTDQNNPNLSKTSPDDSYSVSETMLGDYNTIVVKDNSGKVITNDLIKKNEKAIGYGTKFGCQCGTSFGGWIDGSHFILKIVNGNGEEYQYTVDASTGLVNEASFKKVK